MQKQRLPSHLGNIFLRHSIIVNQIHLLSDWLHSQLLARLCISTQSMSDTEQDLQIFLVSLFSVFKFCIRDLRTALSAEHSVRLGSKFSNSSWRTGGILPRTGWFWSMDPRFALQFESNMTKNRGYKYEWNHRRSFDLVHVIMVMLFPNLIKLKYLDFSGTSISVSRFLTFWFNASKYKIQDLSLVKWNTFWMAFYIL